MTYVSKKLECKTEEKFMWLLNTWAKEQGIELQALKLNLKGNRGYPDRAIFWQSGRCMFIEFKRVDEEPRKLQVHIHGMLRGLGFDVQVHDNEHEALAAVQEAILCVQ